MTAMIGLMALRQSLTLRMGIESEATELPGLAVSVMTFLVVVSLGQLLTERKRAEHDLRESEGRFRTLAEAAPIGVFLTKPLGECIYTNPLWTKISGLSFDESLGYGWTRVIHLDDRDKVNQSWRAAAALGEDYTTDYRIITPGGDVRWVHVLATPQRDASGSVVSYVGSVVDITERKKAEKKLKTRYQELQALHEISQIVLNSLDLQFIVEGILDKTLAVGSFDLGVIRLLDPGAKNLEALAKRGYQYPENVRHLSIDPITQGSGTTLIRVITEKATQVVENVPEFDGWRTFKREGVQSAIVVPVLAQGRILGTIQLGSRKSRKFGPDEIHLLEAIGSQMGIAVQKARLAGETKLNLDRIRALHNIDRAISSTLDLHAVLDILLQQIDVFFRFPSATTVRLLDPETGKMEPMACQNLDLNKWKARGSTLGSSRSQRVAETKTPLIIPDLKTGPYEGRVNFYLERGLVSYLGVPLIAKDKVLGALGLYTKERHEFSDEEVQFLTTLAGQAAIAIQNATLYEEIVAANKVKDEFLSIMSHEIRTPLNTLVGYTEMVRDKMLGEVNQNQEEVLGKVLAQAGNLLGMMSRILLTTQIDAGAIRVESEEVNPGELLDQLKSACHVSSGKDIALLWHYPSDLPVIKTDSNRLTHILQNLINNGIKYTQKGQVVISARHIPGSRRLEFKVADTGIGIPKKSLPIIFEKFRQVDSSETRLYGGVGLGLYIAKQMTETLGATLEVESKLGKGSTFTFTIPRET